MKKIISLVFTVLCLCLLAGTAKAQTPADWEEGGIWYKVLASGDEVAVCQNLSGQDYTGTVTGPDVVTHLSTTYTVTAVGNRAFAASTVEHVNLPNTVVSIGACAFQDAFDLKE
ncbi:MAG: leucine-rich repeat domain-containing protein, partial [Prevotellaceae bacterium]|nr:leucine-rich repeat domain-containing protein [Prevotellaceae bacterium]